MRKALFPGLMALILLCLSAVTGGGSAASAAPSGLATTIVLNQPTGTEPQAPETPTEPGEDAAQAVAESAEAEDAHAAEPVGMETPAATPTDLASAASPTDLLPAPEEEYPRVIDRINFPDLYPDFSFSGEDDLLEVWFCPVRDQDATIFLYQDQVWMLDCGDERALTDVAPLLEYLGVKQVDRLFNTHPHHDHLNGLYAVDAKVPIKELLICFPEDATAHMTAAMEYCKGNGIPVTHFYDENVFSMGDGAVSFLAWLKVNEEESINDRSAQFMISYGACSMLSMADIEIHGQRQLYEALGPEPLKADILRYPHHGKMHMVDEVFAAIDPDLAIITNFPRVIEIQDSTRFLDNRHVNAGYTRRNDHVLHLVTDGNHWLCEDLEPDLKPWTPSLRTGQ